MLLPVHYTGDGMDDDTACSMFKAVTESFECHLK